MHDKKLKLEEIVTMFSARSCTDPRDRIYAALAYMPADEAFRKVVEPDYSLSRVALFERIFEGLKRVYGNPYLALYFSIKIKHALDLPTEDPRLTRISLEMKQRYEGDPPTSLSFKAWADYIEREDPVLLLSANETGLAFDLSNEGMRAW